MTVLKCFPSLVQIIFFLHIWIYYCHSVSLFLCQAELTLHISQLIPNVKNLSPEQVCDASNKIKTLLSNFFKGSTEKFKMFTGEMIYDL